MLFNGFDKKTTLTYMENVSVLREKRGIFYPKSQRFHRNRCVCVFSLKTRKKESLFKSENADMSSLSSAGMGE